MSFNQPDEMLRQTMNRIADELQLDPESLDFEVVTDNSGFILLRNIDPESTLSDGTNIMDRLEQMVDQFDNTMIKEYEENRYKIHFLEI